MRDNNAIALMSRIREKANRLIVAELAKHGVEGIVPSHGEIMLHLFDDRDYTMQELAAKIHRTKPTVTVLVDKLASFGYVAKEKSPTDSRATIVRLTAKGKALGPVFADISTRLNAVVYGGLTEEEAEAFERTLRAVNANLDGYL
jgi:DNA-binding MarR family transcriptional regulator